MFSVFAHPPILCPKPCAWKCSGGSQKMNVDETESSSIGDSFFGEGVKICLGNRIDPRKATQSTNNLVAIVQVAYHDLAGDIGVLQHACIGN